MAQRLPAPMPLEEHPRRPFVLRIRRPGSNAEGVGVIPDLNVSRSMTAAAVNNADFGPQVAPPAIRSFTAAAMSSGLIGLASSDPPLGTPELRPQDNGGLS